LWSTEDDGEHISPFRIDACVPTLTTTDGRRFLASPRSQCVKERETSENVERRLVTWTCFLGHGLQYVQMRCHFRSKIPRTNSGYGCTKEMIRAAYTRLWEFRTRTRIALTKDIRQRHAPRRSKRKKIRPLKCRAKAFSRSSAPFTHKNEKAAGRLLDAGGFRR